MAKTDCSGFVKVALALLPKEFTIDDNRLKDVSDEELEILINELRGKLRSAIVEHPASREGSGDTPLTGCNIISLTKNKSPSTLPARRFASEFAARATSLEKQRLAVSRSPIMPQADIKMTGGESGLIGPLSVGRAVFLARWSRILFNAFWSGDLAVLALALFLKTPSLRL
jgi:hypothetical protein